MAWSSDSDDFATARSLAKGLNLLGHGLLLACAGLLVAAMLGASTAGLVVGLGYAGAIGTLGIVCRAAAYGLAAKEIAERGIVVPQRRPGRDGRSPATELEAVQLLEQDLAEQHVGFVAMLEEEERQKVTGRGG